jgi:hypothetical protein
VRELETDKRIIRDRGLDAHPNTLEWTFSPNGGQAPFVCINNSSLAGDGEATVVQAKDSEAGFALVLAGQKAYLESGIQLNLTADHFCDPSKCGWKISESSKGGLD